MNLFYTSLEPFHNSQIYSLTPTFEMHSQDPAQRSPPPNHFPLMFPGCSMLHFGHTSYRCFLAVVCVSACSRPPGGGLVTRGCVNLAYGAPISMDQTLLSVLLLKQRAQLSVSMNSGSSHSSDSEKQIKKAAH